MSRKQIFASLLLFSAVASAAGPPAAPPKVLAVTYAGIINPVADEVFESAIRRGAAEKVSALVFKLDTPGGLDTSMRAIIQRIIASEVPVVVYVAPSGARAASAGVFITIAAHIAAMAPGTNIGAAHPVMMGGGEMDKEMKKKVENDAAAYIKTIAERRGRNVKWAEDAVRKSVSATEQEALRDRVIDIVAGDLTDLLSKIDGREVVTAAGKVVLKTKGAAVEEIPLSLRLRILKAISDPNVAYILMLLGVYGLIFELSSPGAILPGVVGAISLILAFYAFQTLPINFAGLLLILLAIALFIAEVKVQSFGILGAGGVIAMILGSLMLVQSDLPSLRVSLTVILPSVLLTALFFLLLMALAWRSLRRPAVMGPEALIGRVAVVRRAAAPRGSVLVRGEIWEAEVVGGGTIAEGEEAEVVGVEGLRLKVKKRRSDA